MQVSENQPSPGQVTSSSSLSTVPACGIGSVVVSKLEPRTADAVRVQESLQGTIRGPTELRGVPLWFTSLVANLSIHAPVEFHWQTSSYL